MMSSKARTQLTLMIRASMRRRSGDAEKFSYYPLRDRALEDIIMHQGQAYIVATVRRQRYYELKKKYMEQELIAYEREKMYRYDGYSSEYMVDYEVQLEQEHEARETLRMEEQYAKDYKLAKLREKKDQMKEQVMLRAEEMMRLVAVGMHAIQKHDSDMLWRQAMVEKHKDRIEVAAKKQCVQVMQRLGIKSSQGVSVKAKPLPKLPPDEDPAALLAYYNKYIKPSEAGRKAARVAAQMEETVHHRTFDTDLHMKLNDDQEKIFVKKIAGLLNVSADDIVVHMTPRTPGRPAFYR